jgi:predicted transposase YbfD/YdcC
MSLSKLSTIFSILEDPRSTKSRLHSLSDVLTIILCASMAGVEGWENIELWAEEHETWLKEFLPLENGIPSHDTMERVLEAISPKNFQSCLMKLVKIFQESKPESDSYKTIAIDGKTLRRSFDNARSLSTLHLVGAWASGIRLFLGQVSTEGKGNELAGIREILQLLDIKGSTVTIDAMGAQKDICETIANAKGNYCIGLKGNQGLFFEAVTLQLGGASVESLEKRYGLPVETTDKGHGRIEVRRYWLANDIENYIDSNSWKGLKAIGIADRTVIKGNEEKFERRFFIVSFAKNVDRFANAVRSHWHVESDHWILDVTFNEDSSRIRKRNAAQNMAITRRMVYSIMRQVPGKRNIKQKRMLASFKPERIAQAIAYFVD